MEEEFPKLFDCPDFLKGKYCHALCNYRHQTEEEKRAIEKYRDSFQLKLSPKKSNRFGPVRTSWLFNAVRLLLVHQDSPFGPADSYRLNHITKNDLETRLIEACGRPLVIRTMRIPDSNWAQDLDQSGHGYMVFVSHRDLRDVIDDCLAIGWMKHDIGVILSRLKAYMTAFDYWRSNAKGDFRYESTHHEPVEQIKHLARLMGIESTHAEHIAREINSLRPGQAIGPDQVTKMWPAQRVIEASLADGDDKDDKQTDNEHEPRKAVVVPGQAKLTENERRKIRDVHMFRFIPKVEEFRKTTNEHFSKEISDDKQFDTNDIKRFNENDDYALMIIQHGQTAKTFDEPKALRCFHDTMIWRKQNNIYDVSLDQFPATYLERRAIYYKNHDINNHRLLHYVVRTFNKGELDNEMVKRFMAYNFEEHIRTYPGQRIVILFDMTDTGLRHLDYDLVKFVISALLYYFPGLLSYFLVYKLPFILQAAWKLIKTWMPTETQNGVKFVDEKTITQYVALDQLSKAMGGTSSDES
ncbi:unnamed protein product [Rotaria socialis]|uniref:CRAL-TRIO domain-containing protein n=1 Tax=Rotaria socialis TaxID=392032 RepID=A0A820CTA2_9BILA|nr:unnamed protein product [Rotaria socialis]